VVAADNAAPSVVAVVAAAVAVATTSATKLPSQAQT